MKKDIKKANTKVLWASPVHIPLEDQLKDLNSLADNVTIHYIGDEYPNLANELSNIGLYTDLDRLALALLTLAEEKAYDIVVQPGGNQAFMVSLGKARQAFLGDIWFAYSNRVAIEKKQPDGTVKKSVIFKHEGWQTT